MMKASSHLFILAATSTAFRIVDQTTRELDAASICGELEVMNVNASELPSNISLSELRMCAKHPQGRNRTLDTSDGASLAPANVNKYGPVNNASTFAVRPLAERSCYYNSPYGCSRGSCWKVCDEGTGKWCWAAEKGGYGHWSRCSTYADCGTDEWNFGCGQLCGPQCGCGC
ncbi:hypothetical protein V8C37DRAFT_386846 [Trichoderma ceciliae]